MNFRIKLQIFRDILQIKDIADNLGTEDHSHFIINRSIQQYHPENYFIQRL